MDTDYLYKWVANQLHSGTPKSEIVSNIVNYAKLSREEAEHYVSDPLFREEFKLNSPKESEQETTEEEDISSEIAKIKNKLKELQEQRDKKDFSWFYMLIGLGIGWLIWGFTGC